MRGRVLFCGVLVAIAASAQLAANEFQVNTYTTGYQGRPSVEVDSDGDFVVVWTGYGSGTDTSGYSVQGQRYFRLVFADGFESGDTDAWSSAVP